MGRRSSRYRPIVCLPIVANRVSCFGQNWLPDGAMPVSFRQSVWTVLLILGHNTPSHLHPKSPYRDVRFASDGGGGK